MLAQYLGSFEDFSDTLPLPRGPEQSKIAAVSQLKSELIGLIAKHASISPSHAELSRRYDQLRTAKVLDSADVGFDDDWEEVVPLGEVPGKDAGQKREGWHDH